MMAAQAVTPEDHAAHVLIVDDDTRIRSLLSRFLRENGYRVTTAETAADARAKLSGLSFDVLVLDVMMPGETGLSLAASLRKSMDVPILMLTARAESSDRIAGLETGADDYLTKPFEPRELLLRIAGLIRRASQPAPIKPSTPQIVSFGPFTFHSARGELKQGEENIRITDRERDMLRQLAERPGETVSREALAEQSTGVNERTIDVQINRLRRKIDLDPANPVYLQTVRGSGYRLLIDG